MKEKNVMVIAIMLCWIYVCCFLFDIGVTMSVFKTSGEYFYELERSAFVCWQVSSYDGFLPFSILVAVILLVVFGIINLFYEYSIITKYLTYCSWIAIIFISISHVIGGLTWYLYTGWI